MAGLNFNPVHEVFLGSHPNSLSLIVTQSSSPYTSFGAVIHALPSPPIKVLVTAGAAAIAAELIFDTFGIHDQLVYYANSSALVQGFLRGDANLIGTGYAELIPELNAGIDRALLVGSYGAIGRANPGYAVLSTVPTVGQWLKKDPPKTAGERRDAKFFQIVQSVPNFELAAAAATPAPEAAALDAAARYAFLQPVVKQLLEQVGNVPGFLSPTTGKIDYLSALKYANQISAEIGG